MECKRLNRMIRDWYVQVQDETLAPARMVEFMHDHAETCDTCFVDPNIKEEIKKITAIVLPPSKMTKKPKKKQPPMEPTAAALAAIESGVAAAEKDADASTPPTAEAAGVVDADDIDDEIEVGDDDDVADENVAEDEVVVEGDVVDVDVDTIVDGKPVDPADPSLADADLE